MAKGPDFIETVMVPIHRAGYPFIAGFLLGAVFLGLIWEPLFWIGLVLTAWCTYFFRDPYRVTPQSTELAISPADGMVQSITRRCPPPETGLGSEERTCVAVFMNVFDVHVNRSPIAGRVEKVAYHPGKFLNASLDKASDENERQSFVLRDSQDQTFVLVQIAGLVARRILGFTSEGQAVTAGERVGLIRFGSRCDVYLPEGYQVLVSEGQRAIAGETVLARVGDSDVTIPATRA